VQQNGAAISAKKTDTRQKFAPYWIHVGVN
jgi:hypothetical protein